MKVFLSFSFRDEDKDLVDLLDRLLASHDVRPITGRRLGGGALTPEVMQRIDVADALIALMTRREALPGGQGDNQRYKTHDWVRDEMQRARNNGKPAIALVENGVENTGAYAENEYIALDRDAPLEAILRLSETLGLWKEQLGRKLKARLSPEGVAVPLARANGRWRCRYRLSAQGDFSPWQDVQVVREVGGVFAYLNVNTEGQLVELEVSGDGRQWSSPATGQWMHIELEEI